MSASDWFLARCTAGSEPPARVFCFSYAGGNPRRFLDWQPELAGDAEVVAVCLPGQCHRSREPRSAFAAVADGAAAAISTAIQEDGRPAYLFGHSLGGLMSFEVARRLRGLSALRHLVVSGISAPSLMPSSRSLELAGLRGKDFAKALRFFGGLPPEVVADDEVLELLLPGLIADFVLAASYRYQPDEPLELPVSIITGRDDPHVGPEQVRPWLRECRTPPAFRWVDGGHFYLDERPSEVTGLVRDVVRSGTYVELI